MRSTPLRPFARFAVLVAALCLAACHTQPRVAVAPLPAFDAAFDRASGWVGADGAYSTALGHDRYLWLFGDTFVGQVDGGRRNGARLVANSLALQHGAGPNADDLEFFYRTVPEPTAVFTPDDPGRWFWPLHAVRTGAGLFVFLLEVERTDPRSVFGFRVDGVDLARVVDPDASPAEWQVEVRRIPRTDGHRIFGSYVLAVGGDCYVYGTVEDPAAGAGRQAIVARVACDRLWDFEEWRFFAKGEWVTDVDRVSPICAGVPSEFSISLQTGINRYVMVHSAAGLSPEMAVRFADAPEGPWSDPVGFFRCPEAGRDPRIFCYAAKGHPEMTDSPDELTVSYVANATEFALVEADARLYRPRFLRLKFSGGLFGLP